MLGFENDCLFFFCQRFFFRAGVAGMEPGGVVIKKLMASMHRKREIEAQILTKTVFYLFIYHLLFIYIHVFFLCSQKRGTNSQKYCFVFINLLFIIYLCTQDRGTNSQKYYFVLLIYPLLFIHVRWIEAQIFKITPYSGFM